jgi:hypothetical protein
MSCTARESNLGTLLTGNRTSLMHCIRVPMFATLTKRLLLNRTHDVTSAAQPELNVWLLRIFVLNSRFFLYNYSTHLYDFGYLPTPYSSTLKYFRQEQG